MSLVLLHGLAGSAREMAPPADDCPERLRAYFASRPASSSTSSDPWAALQSPAPVNLGRGFCPVIRGRRGIVDNQPVQYPGKGQPMPYARKTVTSV
ncbi:hypothetical protein [Paractinoplanes brasiliensis]|uniref:Uncharacterized protein n=1 Tax=Paractinoplanes brasiliensis TaxID=52695 RepID=A0A4R6JWE4_9ACTN|nr:hypothetical protein [Actinoplanes brasiliensis]TDO40607.1 hypothetical protein C8E87_4322 [Actinoplanes brasiliensis]GID25676.1 hypothetical protein Abr02nite_06590 [Actinoplanes brasiliensis]